MRSRSSSASASSSSLVRGLTFCLERLYCLISSRRSCFTATHFSNFFDFRWYVRSEMSSSWRLSFSAKLPFSCFTLTKLRIYSMRPGSRLTRPYSTLTRADRGSGMPIFWKMAL